MTEKSLEATKSKRYTFEVQKDATKPEIAHAVEEAFGVTVAKVNTINMKKKPKRLGVHAGYTEGLEESHRHAEGGFEIHRVLRRHDLMRR